MIRLLIFVKHFDVVGVYVTCPLYIEVRIIAFDHIKTSVFAGVDDGVVDMCRV